MVFHSPHWEHRPSHLGDSAPHSVQNHAVLIFFAIASYDDFIRTGENMAPEIDAGNLRDMPWHVSRYSVRLIQYQAAYSDMPWHVPTKIVALICDEINACYKDSEYVGKDVTLLANSSHYEITAADHM